MNARLLSRPEKPIFSTHALLVLLGPLLVEQALAITVGMADTMMVSRAGEAAISGVSLGDMINNLIINIFAALATGGAVVVSQFLGARDTRGASRSAGQLVLLSALLGVGVGALCLATAKPVIHLVYGSIDADVFAASVEYLCITALSYPFLALYNAGAALFRSMGNSRISMRVSILMNLLNIVGNAIGVFGLHLGVAGVAWPSVISRAVAAVLILYAASSAKNEVRLSAAVLRHIDTALDRRILHIGIPSAFENSLFQAGRILVVSMIAGFGTVQISANAVANNLDGMAIIPGQAVGLAMITVVGQCIGAQDHRQAVYYTRRMLLWSYLAMWFSGGLILLCLQPLLGLYALSGATATLSALLVHIHIFSGFVLWPAAFVLPNALRAANDVRYTMLVSILSMAIWRLGFSYVLGVQYGMGAVGVWIAMVIDWACRTICFITRFAGGKWKTKYRAAPENEL